MDGAQPGLRTREWAHLCSQVNKPRLKKNHVPHVGPQASERADGTQLSQASLCAVQKIEQEKLSVTELA